MLQQMDGPVIPMHPTVDVKSSPTMPTLAKVQSIQPAKSLSASAAEFPTSSQSQVASWSAVTVETSSSPDTTK